MTAAIPQSKLAAAIREMNARIAPTLQLHYLPPGAPAPGAPEGFVTFSHPVRTAAVASDSGDLASLHIQAVAMGALVIEQVQLAVSAYSGWDRSIATVVLERERKINLYKKFAGEKCF